ncbi:MAG: GTPase HflX, partial [Gammaproteobacteria bacterium]|nr:GTPase HflX [Gammaproteobacteria bacterium]
QEVWLSAQTGEGIELLREALHDLLAPELVITTLKLPPNSGKLRSSLYAMQCVTEERAQDDGDVLLSVRVPAIEWQRLLKQFGEQLTRSLQNEAE